METIFNAPDIECGGCAASIKKALGQENGVQAVTVDVADKTVAVTFDSSQSSREKIADSAYLFGFSAAGGLKIRLRMTHTGNRSSRRRSRRDRPSYSWFFLGSKAAKQAETILVDPAATLRADLAITGMTCAACVSRVEKAARRVSGVGEATVNLLVNQGAFTYDPAQTSPQAIAAAIEKIGYDAAPLIADKPQQTNYPAEGRSLARRFWVAAILTLPVLLGAMGLELGLSIPRGLASPWTQLLLTTPVLFWAGSRFFPGGVAFPAPAQQRHEHADRPRHRDGLFVFAGGDHPAPPVRAAGSCVL